ncbi:protein neuralized-like [Diaphorina citri]|uniref:Protein neuralized n=1 Tax=Diaphorina citri TaxID=121845 RepID=A0A3Q0JID6_DIACI|nr:protein neuralized-like [Diaphorina citri]
MTFVARNYMMDIGHIIKIRNLRFSPLSPLHVQKYMTFVARNYMMDIGHIIKKRNLRNMCVTTHWMRQNLNESLSLVTAPRTGSNSGTNNLPPLYFHQVHGENVRVSRDGTVAKRYESFCKGVAFSSRPVKINEKVYVKLLEISTNWSGVIRFGFTANDPAHLKYALPRYVCPDLTNKPGYWAKALAERFADQETVLFYYVTAAGDVHFGINGEEKGVFFTGVETRGPLWAMFDIYGNSTAIQLIDSRAQLNNARRVSTHLSPEELSSPINNNSNIDLMNRYIVNSMAAMNVHPQSTPAPLPEDTQVPLRALTSPQDLVPLPFHRTIGRNVRLSNDRTIASRRDTEFSQGYVFTGRPVQLGEKIVIQVLETESRYYGALALGLTSCNPASLKPSVFLREVTMSRNGSPPTTLMHVDHTLTLWAFFDIYGSTQKIRVLGSSRLSLSPPSNGIARGPHPATSASSPCPQPPPQSAITSRNRQPPPVQSRNRQPPPVQPVNSAPAPPIDTRSKEHQQAVRDWAESFNLSASGSGTGSTMGGSAECTVCYEKPIDAVLYMCGHMCMCYECARQQWQGKGGGHCPMCRAVIRDVIRTYKS